MAHVSGIPQTGGGGAPELSREHRRVSFGEAIRLFFVNYVNFQGRSSRGAFWWWFLASILFSLAAGVLDALLFGPVVTMPAGAGMEPAEFTPVSSLYALGTLLPSIALPVRRLHDIGKSGWWILIVFIPVVGWIILLVWYARPGVPAENRFGPDAEAGREAPE